MNPPVRYLLRDTSPCDPDPPILAGISRGALERSPGVLVCPGGGYVCRAPHEAETVAEFLGRQGFATAVLHYRVAPHRYPAALDDARRAMRLWRSRAAEWRLDPSRVAVLGFSAGGHLVAILATQPEACGDGDPLALQHRARPDAVALAYPVISFEEHAHEGSVATLLGSDATPEMRRRLSAHRNVAADSPPAFLFHTADDPAVPAENSLLYAAACTAHGVPCELHLLPHGRHGVGLAADDPVLGVWPAWLVDWLHRTFGSRPAPVGLRDQRKG